MCGGRKGRGSERARRGEVALRIRGSRGRLQGGCQLDARGTRGDGCHGLDKHERRWRRAGGGAARQRDSLAQAADPEPHQLALAAAAATCRPHCAGYAADGRRVYGWRRPARRCGGHADQKRLHLALLRLDRADAPGEWARLLLELCHRRIHLHSSRRLSTSGRRHWHGGWIAAGAGAACAALTLQCASRFPSSIVTQTKGPPGANLFVVRKMRRGEYDTFNSEDLRREFSRYGTVTRAEITIDKDTGWSKGFGFVSFDSVEAADAALAAIHGSWMDGCAAHAL